MLVNLDVAAARSEAPSDPNGRKELPDTRLTL